jgi:hypothetical protein
MPMLGDILAAARRSGPEVERYLAASEPDLAARLRAVAARAGETPAAYLRIAVADFDRFADEEAWSTLTSRLRDSAAPGTTCLLAMLAWSLARYPAEGTPE